MVESADPVQIPNSLLIGCVALAYQLPSELPTPRLYNEASLNLSVARIKRIIICKVPGIWWLRSWVLESDITEF